jgi:predicted aspartyl protease
MKIEFRDGLLFTSIMIVFCGRSKVVENIVIDTGASHSLISQDSVDELGLMVTKEDEIITSYGIGGKEHAFVKQVEKIVIDEYIVENFPLDFTSFIYEDINGLLGLDILIKAGFILDLNQLNMYRQ